MKAEVGVRLRVLTRRPSLVVTRAGGKMGALSVRRSLPLTLDRVLNTNTP